MFKESFLAPQGSLKGVLKRFQGCFNEVISGFQGCTISVLGLFKEN